MLDGILLEKAGIPAVSIVTDPFVETGREMATDWGVPEYRFLSIPHPIANLTEAEMDDLFLHVSTGRLFAAEHDHLHALALGK